MAVSPPVCDFGRPAPDFTLLEPLTGKQVSWSDIRGRNGTLVMFLCNHCPYVQAIIDRIIRDAGELADHGIGSVAICSNDAASYPEDAPDRLADAARRLAMPFPYLHDETQDVARAYGAECTPDFFGYNASGMLQYRGRLDASGRQPASPDVQRELFNAMVQIARTGEGPREQTASMGCSIKWKE